LVIPFPDFAKLHLVGGIPTPLKNMKWKIKFMFETTNQIVGLIVVSGG